MKTVTSPSLSAWQMSARPRSANRLSKALFIATLLFLVQGCKLILAGQEGGSIESRTGANDCPAGETCIITVPGVPFSDTFTAIPAEGYVFTGWKDAPDHICRGSTDPCALENIPAVATAYDIELSISPNFEVDLLQLLPQATRGIFQTYPTRVGAIATTTSAPAWALGPLQVLQQYSAGLNLDSVSERLVLAQMGDAPDEFMVVSRLDTTDVDTLLSSIEVTSATDHLGFSTWSIDETPLQVAKLDERTLVIASETSLHLALDSYTGAKPSITSGPLAEAAPGINQDYPNIVIYGLPALYGSVAAPGDGQASLSQARIVVASFAIESDTLTGILGFYNDNSAAYTSKLKSELSGYPSPVIGALGDLTIINLEGLSASSDVLALLKTLSLDMDAIDYTAAVEHGGNLPWLNFEVGGDPAAIFINFEFDGPDAITAFEAEHLPAGFTMAPFRMIEGDPLRYMMVLNIYQSSGGLVEGARAEWSIFVNDPDSSEPRFWVVEAKAETISADSVNLLTLGEPVSYALNAGALDSYVGLEDPETEIETTYFSASIPWPQPASTYVPFDRFFMPANDFVFWGNAVADKTLYNSTAANRDGSVVPAGQFTYQDNSIWAQYLKDEPIHAVVYLNNQEIVISPWWNLDEDYLDVTPEYRQTLIDFKNNFYPSTVQGLASSAIRGEGIALSATSISDTVPTAYYHFPLSDAAGLLTAIAGPGAYTPAAVPLFADETAGNYVTLTVVARKDDPCGLRAEWSTYVTNAEGRPESLRLDAVAANACLDPISLLTMAADVAQSSDGSTLATRINTPFINFEATVDLGATDSELVALNWLEATERVCSLNNVCDEFYYDGQRVVIPAQRADTAATQVSSVATPWDAYIDTAGVRTTIRQNAALQVLNPWRNQRTFAADAAVP